MMVNILKLNFCKVCYSKLIINYSKVYLFEANHPPYFDILDFLFVRQHPVHKETITTP